MHHTEDTQTSRNELRTQLLRGDISRIAEIAGVHRNTVCRWFDGDNDLSNVQQAVTGVIEERREAIQKRIKTSL